MQIKALDNFEINETSCNMKSFLKHKHVTNNQKKKYANVMLIMKQYRRRRKREKADCLK